MLRDAQRTLRGRSEALRGRSEALRGAQRTCRGAPRTLRGRSGDVQRRLADVQGRTFARSRSKRHAGAGADTDASRVERARPHPAAERNLLPLYLRRSAGDGLPAAAAVRRPPSAAVRRRPPPPAAAAARRRRRRRPPPAAAAADSIYITNSRSRQLSRGGFTGSLREFVLCQRNDLFEPGRGEGILQITPSCSAKPGKAGQDHRSYVSI